MSEGEQLISISFAKVYGESWQIVTCRLLCSLWHLLNVIKTPNIWEFLAFSSLCPLSCCNLMLIGSFGSLEARITTELDWPNSYYRQSGKLNRHPQRHLSKVFHMSASLTPPPPPRPLIWKGSRNGHRKFCIKLVKDTNLVGLELYLTQTTFMTIKTLHATQSNTLTINIGIPSWTAKVIPTSIIYTSKHHVIRMGATLCSHTAF